jgi:hypothetical protein
VVTRGVILYPHHLSALEICLSPGKLSRAGMNVFERRLGVLLIVPHGEILERVREFQPAVT